MPSKTIPTVLLAIGVLLTGFAFYMSWSYGQLWLVEKGNTIWRMNNYTIVPCWLAYSVFGVGFFWISSLLAGIILAGGIFHRLFTKIRWKQAFTITIIAFILGIIGCNTLEYMCNWIFWNEGNPPPPMTWTLPILNIQLPIDPWNYYFGFIMLPLAISGFLVSFSSLWLMKLQK